MESEHVPTTGMEPSLNEVQQVEEDAGYVLPVKVCDPTETRELPAKRIGPRTVVVGTTVASKLLSDDPRRKSAIIIARVAAIHIGATQSQAQLTGAWIPNAIPVTITSRSELWAISNDEETDVTVIEEYWA